MVVFVLRCGIIKNMGKYLVNRKIFEKEFKINKGNFSRHFKDVNKLAPAADGDYLDINHKNVYHYLSNLRKKAMTLEEFKRRNPPYLGEVIIRVANDAPIKANGALKDAYNDPDFLNVPSDIVEFLDLTLRDIFKKFGTQEKFYNHLKAVQSIVSINEKILKNAAIEGDLVSRDKVQKGVIDVVNSALLRLMSDGAKNITATAMSKHMAGDSMDTIEKHVSDVIGSFIKPMKSKINNALKGHDL